MEFNNGLLAEAIKACEDKVSAIIIWSNLVIEIVL